MFRLVFLWLNLVAVWSVHVGSKDYHPGVHWQKQTRKWFVQRMFEGRSQFGGLFGDLEKAKRASDDLVHKFEAKNGKFEKYKLNFPRGAEGLTTQMHGVTCRTRRQPYKVQRYIGGKIVYGGVFDNLEKAQQASDNLVYEHERNIGRLTKYVLNFPREDVGGKIIAQADSKKRMRDGTHKQEN
jgi:hypothetical protein